MYKKEEEKKYHVFQFSLLFSVFFLFVLRSVRSTFLTTYLFNVPAFESQNSLEIVRGNIYLLSIQRKIRP